MVDSTVKQLMESFLESLSTEKGYSLNTCRAYKRDLEEFYQYLKTDMAESCLQENFCAFSGHVGVSLQAFKRRLVKQRTE